MLWSLVLSCLVVFLVLVASFTQPVALGWLLLCVTAAMMGYYYLIGFYWGSLALFIVFVGGLLVAFSFISATASNWTLVEYFMVFSWANLLLAVFALFLFYLPSRFFAFSSSGFMSSVSAVVDGPSVVVFWLAIFSLLLVLLAGVKMCIGFTTPLHWLK